MQNNKNLFYDNYFIDNKIYYSYIGKYKTPFIKNIFKKQHKNELNKNIVLNGRFKKSNKYLIKRTVIKRKRNLLNKHI